jgi:hypothetical protein
MTMPCPMTGRAFHINLILGKAMVIIVEFVGGFRDGTRASSASEDPGEAELALNTWFISNQGEIGRKHGTASDAAKHILMTEGGQALAERGLGMSHFYKVVSKTVNGDETIVRFESVEPS